MAVGVVVRHPNWRLSWLRFGFTSDAPFLLHFLLKFSTIAIQYQSLGPFGDSSVDAGLEQLPVEPLFAVVDQQSVWPMSQFSLRNSQRYSFAGWPLCFNSRISVSACRAWD